MKALIRPLLVLTTAALLAMTPKPAGSEKALEKTFGTYVDEKGTIAMPEDFRKDFSHLGSWFVPEGEASGFHDVYAQAEAVDHYRKNGSFPDGAVLVKELRAHDSKAMTTGVPAWANTILKQWFVMVKDEKGRFKDNGSWGEGWGWALFQPGKKGNVSKNFRTDCMGCHVPAKATDWIYVEGYPTLTP